MTDKTKALLPADIFVPAPPDFRPPKIPNLAENAIQAIYKEFADFERRLDAEQEIAMCIVGGPSSLCFHVRRVYRYGGDKLVFEGFDSESKPVRLMQHLMQLNLLMMAAPKIGPIAVRMGFHAPAGVAAD
jgi:hypothetical protein